MQLSATLFALYKAAGVDNERIQVEELTSSLRSDTDESTVTVYYPSIRLLHQVGKRNSVFVSTVRV